MAKKKAEPLDGWRLHPVAARVCVVLMIIASLASGFKGELGISGLPLAMIVIPGFCGAALLAFQHAAIWQREGSE